MSIVTLLPVRNGLADLSYYFKSVASFSDIVLALDDGSTDDTLNFLHASPLVREILTNPVRSTADGWDDCDNRSRLLELSKKYNPSWIVWLDSDEYIEPSEGRVLRRFLHDYAGDPVAFGLEVLRVIENMEQYDKCSFWSFRVHTALKNMSLPLERLHFEPVPVEIPEDNHIKTNFQVKHRAGMSERRRIERYNKYQECDPSNIWQESYENLLSPPGKIKQYINKVDSEGVIRAEHMAKYSRLSKGVML